METEKIICQLQSDTIIAYKQVSGLSTILNAILNKLSVFDEKIETLKIIDGKLELLEKKLNDLSNKLKNLNAAEDFIEVNKNL